MKITIHQSLCGEINKAWGLLKTTMPDNNVAKSIAFKTDLQEQTGDIDWKPAIRGFSEGDYFLIMKTFDDTTTEVRRGRKFSHVLIIQNEDIIKIGNIESIINLLPANIDKNATIEPIIIDVTDQYQINILSQNIQERFNRLIHGYVNLKDYENTLIWIGQDGFDLIVIELWKRLSKDERKSFHFGISFNNDINRNEGIRLMTAPESIQSKFVKSGYFLIGKNDSHRPTELIEQLLIGDSSTQNRINAFEKAIEAGPLTREEISFVAKGINTFEQLETTSDIKKINTLSHIIAQYSPSNTQGVSYKSQVLRKIVQLIGTAKFQDVVVLRAFKIESYKLSEQNLSKYLIEWILKNIFSVKNHSTDYKLFFDHIKDTNLNWWDKVVNNELSNYLDTINISKVSVIYQWLIEVPSILNKIAPFLNKSRDSETIFLKKLPKGISNELIEILKSFSINNGWLRIYAQILMIQLNWKEALSKLLDISKDKNAFDAIKIILKDVNDKSIIDYTVRTGNPFMIDIAGKICHKSPKLLNAIDVLNDNWVKLWLEGINNGNQVEAGIKEPDKKIHKLFDRVILKKDIPERLLDEISKSDYGDLLPYLNMSKLWEHLSNNTKENFLTKTSAALLGQLSKNSTTEIPDDTILVEHINRKGITDFLYFNSANIKSVIPIFEKFSQLHDDNLKDYINNFPGEINSVEATRLGKLVYGKNYYNSAHTIYNKSTKNNNWKFALAECHYLLDMWTKGALVFSGILSTVNITSDQWWESAEDLIIELFPSAASLITIWRKSGGKESELIMNATPNSVWNDALNRLRRDQFKNISMNNLLNEIKKQYGNDEKFKIIYDLRTNFIKMN